MIEVIAGNNPFNIRFGSAQWRGLTGSRRGFCEFSSVAFAVRVVLYLFLRSYAAASVYSLRDAIARFCPVGDGNNDPDRYYRFVISSSSLLGGGGDVVLRTISMEQWYQVLSAMSRLESGYILAYAEFYEGWRLFYEEG